VKTFIVGGAIRDRLLGLAVKDVDYVVVGATPEDLINKGFKPVGQDFPVFLHPETHEEYALARTERKVAPGYKGFIFHADPKVTLEEDLARRDLTINAIAQEISLDGELIGPMIDPFGGIKDIQEKVLRHIGTAFLEDPVRLLRVARFSAKFPDFLIAPKTIEMLKKIGQSGELKALVKERVWQEFSKGLLAKQPSKLLLTLQACNVFEVFFPTSLIKNGSMLQQLDEAAKSHFNLQQRCAILLAMLDVEEIKSWSNQWGIPVECKDYACLASDLSKMINQATTTSDALLDILDRMDVWRKPERFNELMMVAKIQGFETEPLVMAYLAARKVNAAGIAADLTNESNAGQLIKEKIRAARIAIIKEL
jgi:tRNA nucleotidyltransferase (CCA-adding enzyme)